jgi:integrase
MTARMRKRADGRYVVTVTYEDRAGARRRHYIYGKTQAEANAKAKAARRRVDSGDAGSRCVPDAQRLAGRVASDVPACQRSGSRDEAALRGTDQAVRRSSDRLDPAGPAQACRRDPHAAQPGGGGQVREHPSQHPRSLAWCSRRRGGQRAPGGESRPEGQTTSRVIHRARALTKDEVAALLRGAEGLRYATVLRLILGTGLRREEALALRWTDLDLDRGEACVTGSLVRIDGALVVAETKTPGAGAWCP